MIPPCCGSILRFRPPPFEQKTAAAGRSALAPATRVFHAWLHFLHVIPATQIYPRRLSERRMGRSQWRRWRGQPAAVGYLPSDCLPLISLICRLKKPAELHTHTLTLSPSHTQTHTYTLAVLQFSHNSIFPMPVFSNAINVT